MPNLKRSQYLVYNELKQVRALVACDTCVEAAQRLALESGAIHMCQLTMTGDACFRWLGWAQNKSLMSIRDSTLVPVMSLVLLCGRGDRTPTSQHTRRQHARSAEEAKLATLHPDGVIGATPLVRVVSSVFDADALADLDPESDEGRAVSQLAFRLQQVRSTIPRCPFSCVCSGVLVSFLWVLSLLLSSGGPLISHTSRMACHLVHGLFWLCCTAPVLCCAAMCCGCDVGQADEFDHMDVDEWLRFRVPESLMMPLCVLRRRLFRAFHRSVIMPHHARAAVPHHVSQQDDALVHAMSQLLALEMGDVARTAFPMTSFASTPQQPRHSRRHNDTHYGGGGRGGYNRRGGGYNNGGHRGDTKGRRNNAAPGAQHRRGGRGGVATGAGAGAGAGGVAGARTGPVSVRIVRRTPSDVTPGAPGRAATGPAAPRSSRGQPQQQQQQQARRPRQDRGPGQSPHEQGRGKGQGRGNGAGGAGDGGSGGRQRSNRNRNRNRRNRNRNRNGNGNGNGNGGGGGQAQAGAQRTA